MRTSLMILSLACCAVAFGEGPATATPQKSLKLEIPTGWKDVSKPASPDKPGPASIVIATREKTGLFSVQIVFLHTSKAADAIDDDTLKLLLGNAAKPYLDGSDQTEIKPQPLDGDQTHGFFTTLTAKAAKAGESACVTLAHVKLGDGILAATIRHPDGSPNLPKALDMIKTATLAAPATKPAAKPAAKPAVGKPVGKPLNRTHAAPPAK